MSTRLVRIRSEITPSIADMKARLISTPPSSSDWMWLPLSPLSHRVR